MLVENTGLFEDINSSEIEVNKDEPKAIEDPVEVEAEGGKRTAVEVQVEDQKNDEDGVAPVKAEFRKPKVLDYDERSSSSKRERGQNKKREGPCRRDVALKLCNSVSKGQECTRDKCGYLHDKKKYLETKIPDIGGPCHMYDTFGFCRQGIKCRFSAAHTNPETLEQLTKPELIKENEDYGITCNLNNNTAVMKALSRRKYNFKKAEALIKAVKAEDNNEKTKNGAGPSVPEHEKTESVDQPLRKSEKKTIDFTDKSFLAPLTTVGNLPFRRICKEYGVDVTCAEMAYGFSLLKGQSNEWVLLRRHKSEDLFGVQVAGAYGDRMTQVAQAIEENLDVDFVDLNCGCPIDGLYEKGVGSGLVTRKNHFRHVVKGMSRMLSCPLTVKMRTGTHKGHENAHLLVPKIFDYGASLVTIHGRTREQRYSNFANWTYVNSCVDTTKPRPVFGNGDVLSWEEAVERSKGNVSGVMIGRGALIKPWLFTEIKEQRHWDISSGERLDILKKFSNYGMECWGSDFDGVERTRRFMLEWLSFLHRYIPVGLLERVPQKMNDRPPPFFGRNDLETLMASDRAADWIKISEMILGPVPDEFHFEPKHKARSY